MRAVALVSALLLFSTVLVGCLGSETGLETGEGPSAAIWTPTNELPLDHAAVFHAVDIQDPVGDGLEITWDMGDGTTYNGANITHTYAALGEQQITLTVRDASDRTITQSAVYTVVDPFEQEVWFNWDSTQLDVLLLHIHDPVVGAAIQEAIDAWITGINELAPELGAELDIRVYWPVTGLVPPADFDPDIFFVPVGFMASSGTPMEGTCTAFAPAGYLGGEPGDQAELYFTAAHEFGHCLGLSHVFYQGVEYEPAFDLLGGGSVHHEFGKSCPSNLNIEILRMVFAGEQGRLAMVPSQYHQASAC